MCLPKKVRRAYSIGALDAPAQGASFYVEIIKLASNLRIIPEMELVGHFQTPIHEIALFASLNTLNDFFLYKTQKQPIMRVSGQFQLFSTFQSDYSRMALR